MTKIKVLGIWEKFNGPDFKPVEFDGFKKKAGDGMEFFSHE
jgi:hypothetical protein